MKKILIFSIIFLLFLNLIFLVSANKMSGSFTITGEAVEEANKDSEESFLNSIKNFFIYAFTLGGEFEIKAPETTSEESNTIKASTGKIINQTDLKDKTDDSKDKEELGEYNQTNKMINEEATSEKEIPWKTRDTQTAFIIVMTLIIIVLFLLKRKISKLFGWKKKGRKKK